MIRRTSNGMADKYVLLVRRLLFFGPLAAGLAWPAARAGAQDGPSSDDSIYTTTALRALVAGVAARNIAVPAQLASYRARAETEFSFLTRFSTGTEGAAQIEQVASVVQWLRTGAFTQHITGYRAQLAGINFSGLGLVHRAWTVPVLYGNRLDLFAGSDTTGLHRLRGRATDAERIAVVHPFARDREAVYRFSGGDTVVTLRAGAHVVPVVRIHVTPRTRFTRATAVFEGDVYVDAARQQIVRMRGTFDVRGLHPDLRARVRDALVHGAFFVDLVNAEIDGQFWLPATQRIEAQLSSGVGGDTRSVLRVVTHFTDYRINDTTLGPLPSSADTLALLPHTLTFAPADSMASWRQWDEPLGAASESVRADDFRDLAPDRWRDSGPPQLGFRTDGLGELLHFDRIEGLYTGAGAQLRFRDAAPGLTVRVTGGWAWWERTARGTATLEWLHDGWTTGVRVARTLDVTNDFTTSYSSGPGLAALIGQDNYDYVNRKQATAYVTRSWDATGSATPLVARFEIGPEEDVGDRARLGSGIFPPSLFMSDSLFRPNRGVVKGDYVRGALTLAYNPSVDAGLVRPGIGARLHVEEATGQLDWERVEVSVSANHPAGPFLIGGRLDAGVVAGSHIPPQQIFEIGYTEGMLAYDYKEFGGNDAAVLQEQVLYQLPMWRAPLRVSGLILPSPGPSIALGTQVGWAAATTLAAREALVGLGPRVNPATNVPLIDPMTGTTYPASRPTGDARTSTDLMLRFFGGSVGLGVAHALSGGAPERWPVIFRVIAAL